MQHFKRILLKLSGEGLANNSNILDSNKLKNLSKDIKYLLSQGIEVAIVIGGGNICRGSSDSCNSFSRVTKDNMGMLATIINGLSLSDILLQNNIPCVVFSAIELNKVTEFYNVERTKEFLSQKKVVILVGGIANPFFSTDTASVIRAVELNCCAILKATQVDGVFDKDPKIYKEAQKIDEVTYDEVIYKKLLVMDLQSIVIAKSTSIPIYIFNIHNESSISNLIKGKLDYSVIH